MSMIKVLEFGGVIEQTGETAVTLINDTLIKQASNDIQDFWQTCKRDPQCCYLHVIAMSAGEFWGANRRGDWFAEKDLKEYYKLFQTQAKVYKHHQNKPTDPSFGRVIYAYYNDHMHRVELVLEIDKINSPEIVRKIKQGEDLFVSMGVKVPEDECSICGNRAKKLSEYCEHTSRYMNRILSCGKQVYVINHAPLNLFDISLVTRPADPIAWSLQKAASLSPVINNASFTESNIIPSAFDGERIEKRAQLRNAVEKVADIIKRVDGKILNYSHDDGTVNSLVNNFSKLQGDVCLPTHSYEEMESLHMPAAMMLLLALCNKINLSLDELTYYIGKLVLDKCFSKEIHNAMGAALPIGIPYLQEHLEDVLEFPKLVIKMASDEQYVVPDFLNKLASFVYIADERDKLLKLAELNPNSKLDRILLQKSVEEAAESGIMGAHIPLGNFEMITIKDPIDPSKEYKTNVLAIKQQATTVTSGAIEPIVYAAKLAPITLGALAITSGKAANVAIGIPSVILGKLIFDHTKHKYRKERDLFSINETSVLEKKAGLESLTKFPVAGALGIGVPAALALDYQVANRRYHRDPMAYANLGAVGKSKFAVGKAAFENPATATVGGLALAGLGKGVVQGLAKKYKLPVPVQS